MCYWWPLTSWHVYGYLNWWGQNVVACDGSCDSVASFCRQMTLPRCGRSLCRIGWNEFRSVLACRIARTRQGGCFWNSFLTQPVVCVTYFNSATAVHTFAKENVACTITMCLKWSAIYWAACVYFALFWRLASSSFCFTKVSWDIHRFLGLLHLGAGHVDFIELDSRRTWTYGPFRAVEEKLRPMVQ